MPTSFDTNPSSTNNDDFSIHTMQDDLLKMRASGQAEEIPLKKDEANPTPNRPITPTPLAKKDYIPETKSPFAANMPVGTNKIETNKLTEVVPEENLVEDEKPFVFKLIWTLIILFLISIFALSGYYFWMTRSESQTTENTAPTENQTPAETAPVEIVTPVEKYSTDKPNYLVLDVATLSANEIKASIISTANDLKANATQDIHEFIAVDSNNNPITFQIFAIAADIELSQNILSNLENDFSLFLFNEGGEMRLGLSIKVKDKDIVAKELLVQEKLLSTDISTLLLDSKVETAANTFSDGTYNDNKTRYMNLNSAGTLSIDYALTNNSLIIGTSKNTLRAIMDRQTLVTSNIKVPDDTNISPVGNMEDSTFKETPQVIEPTTAN